VGAGRIDSAHVDINDTPRLPEGMEEQLRQTYRDEHEDQDLEDSEVYRYLITAEGAKGSLHELGMGLGRLLTPHAVLPKDWVLLEDEQAHELPAIVPWALAVSRSLKESASSLPIARPASLSCPCLLPCWEGRSANAPGGGGGSNRPATTASEASVSWASSAIVPTTLPVEDCSS